MAPKCIQFWRSPLSIKHVIFPVIMSKVVIFAFAVFALASSAANYPSPVAADFVLTNFQFHSGQTLPAVRMHYLRLGNPERDPNGMVRNVVLILHGT